MMKCRDRLLAMLASAVSLALTGCPPATTRIPFAPISKGESVRIVNDNLARIDGTLKASGTVDGFFTGETGRKRSYHLDGTLFYLAPKYLRFDLKKFGDRQILLGSNEWSYWYYSKDDDTYRCGRHDAPQDWPADIPVRPDRIVDALGLSRIQSGDPPTRLLQRVVEDYQQLLFVESDGSTGVTIEKEYWVDRYAPQLVRRVIFRNANGVVDMRSDLDGYRRIAPAGPWLPHVITVDWPATKTRMRYRIARWTPVQQVTPDGIQFAMPEDCESLQFDGVYTPEDPATTSAP